MFQAPSLFLLAILAGAEPPKGTLVVMGGGPTPADVVRQVVRDVGDGAKVVVIPQASARENTGEASAALWRDAGAKEVRVLDLTDAKKAVADVRAADVVWMPGGDQNRLMKALDGTGVPEALRQRYQEGATVGGTSAGAAVLSGVMLTGEADGEHPVPGASKTAAGLGLWQGVVVDQHFLQRGRVERLLAAVLDQPALVGVGIDESTAVLVRGTRFEVRGKGNVTVIDARKATVGKERPAASGVVVHVLRPGMTFDSGAGAKPRR